MVWHLILVRQKYCCFTSCIYPKAGMTAVAFEPTHPQPALTNSLLNTICLDSC